MPKMKKQIMFVLPCILLFSAITFAQADKPDAVKTSASSANSASPATRSTPTEREQDGYLGPVRRVKTEVSKMSSKGGKFNEGARTLLENAVYDLKGAKNEYDYFPNAVTAVDATGRETYKYNEKGDISEMTLLNADGSVAKKETYNYEYDFFGNWTKMTTSVAVVEGGKVIYEPTEITYRTISYFVDEATMKRMEEEKKNAVAVNTPATNPAPVQPAPVQPAPPSPNPSTVAANNNASQPNTQPAASKTSTPTPPQPTPANAQPNKPEPTTASNVAAAQPKSGTETKPETAKNETKEAGNPPVPVVNTEQMVKSAPKMLRPVSSGVLNGKAVDLPMPEYPPMAKQARVSGTVTVEVVIDEMGKVVSARALTGSGMLQPAAVNAAKRARFSPTMLSGQPVKAIGTINYNFSL